MSLEWICPFGLGFLAGTVWMWFCTRGAKKWLFGTETEQRLEELRDKYEKNCSSTRNRT